MNLGNYYNTKTVKLSDSYVVYITNLRQRTDNNKLNQPANTDVWDPWGNIGQEFNAVDSTTKYTDNRFVELMSCIDVKLPSYKYKVESHKYGNLAYRAILPDYEAKPNFTLTIAETKDHTIEALLKLIIRRNIKHGGSEKMQYVDNGWIDVIAIDVLSNDLHKPVLRYAFGLCRLINYDVYDLDYSKDDLPTYKLTFSFETYEKQYNPTKDGIEQLILETRNNVTQVNTLQNNQNSTQVNSNVDSFNTI